MTHRGNTFTGKEEKTGWFNLWSQELFVLDYSVQHANYIHLLVQKWHPAIFLGVNPDRIISGQSLTMCLPAIALSPLLQ